MLSRIAKLSQELSAILLYTTSEILQYTALSEIAHHFGVDSNYITECVSARAAKSAQRRSLTAPLVGNKWITIIDCDRLTKSDILSLLDTNTYYGVCIYTTSKYQNYQFIANSRVAKSLGVSLWLAYMNKLEPDDIYLLYKLMYLNKGLKPITEELIEYVCSMYTYDIDAVCSLFESMRTGVTVTSKNDIIQLVGLGGVAIEHLLISILTTNEKVSKQKVRNILLLLETIKWKYDYSTIRNYMLSSLRGFIELKQLTLSGNIRKYYERIPENFDERGIRRVRRFESQLQEIPLLNILKLKEILQQTYSYDAELSIISGLYKYFELIYDTSIVIEDKVKKGNSQKSGRTRAKKAEKVNSSDTDNSKDFDLDNLRRLLKQ